MKLLVSLAALLSVAATDVAVAAVAHRRHHHRPVARAPISYTAVARPVRRVAVRRRVAAHGSPAQSAKAQRSLALRDTPAEAPDRPGWFKANGRAGYGVKRGEAETMVGLYSRPVQTVIGGPDIYRHEGRGAAGVALTLKLGR